MEERSSLSGLISITEFLVEKKIAISIRNQANRTKKKEPINHHFGSKPLSHRAEEFLKAGKRAPFVCAALDAYSPSTHGKEICQKLKRKLDMIQEEGDEDEENAQPLTIDAQSDILIDIFGERKGTEVIGMGGAYKRTPKVRGGRRFGSTQEAEERNQELAERIRVAEASSQQDKEVAKRMQEEHKIMKEENQDLKGRVKMLRVNDATIYGFTSG